ncbi:response regulator transcription factor [Halobacillus salinarum]|uniref:Response regulator transcription factor n=1 Tax=Halobacillus salinarum TaxID=2932257 RepID=A0ABY4EK74_9BACI|nr:response regulator transcription factor [Halobacillus salinarum]UOQ43922.1 response regulator transcription factor [Halobacillus salinarum]
MIEILLVDDHPSVGAGTKLMIEKEEDMIVTNVESPGEALEIIGKKTFDIMLLDLRMSGMNGIELSKKMRSTGNENPILIYTGYDIGPYFNTLVEAGVSGFISKTESRENLIQAIRCGIQGKSIVPVSLFAQLRKMEVRVEEEKQSKDMMEEVSITSKEQEILKEVAKGKSNKEIAKEFFKSPRTIEYNLTEIFKKLQVKTRAEAVLKSKQWGILPEEID